jgi:uncharacterized phage protein (TIGR01671 family)
MRADKKGWVRGHYFTTPLTAEYDIDPENGDFFECRIDPRRHVIADEDDGCAFEVIPETVGEFTSLHDKNGKEIYEGDIVRTEISIGDIQFSHGVFGAEWTRTKKSKSMLGEWGQRHNLRRLDDDTPDHLEVIGNIHENANLLNQQ